MLGHRVLRLLGALPILGGLCSATGTANASWTVAFKDDGRAQWQQLFKPVGQSCNVITRSGASLRVKSCPLTASGNQTAMVWARKKVSGRIKVELDLDRK